VNSLVDVDLDFKKNIRNIEEINREYNDKLEDLIKKRILDENYDDR
jgi:U3 small nucleolar ribonucleoprotein component